MKKMCHAFVKANNIFAKIMLIVSIIGLVTGIIGLVVGISTLAMDESESEAIMAGGVSLVSLGAFLTIFCTFALVSSIVCSVFGKKLLQDLENGASKNQMIGKAIGLIVCCVLFTGFLPAGIAILATPNRYFINEVE